MPEEPVYAGQRFGVAPYAGDDVDPQFPDLQAGVDLTAPVADVMTRLTTLTWVFEAPLDPGGIQQEFRVQLEVAGEIVYDSGWEQTAQQSHEVDLGALGFADVTDVSFRVAAHQSSRGFSGVDENVVDVLLGQPTVAFLEPDPAFLTYDQPLVNCQWSYVDTQTHPQAESRVRLLLGTLVLYDSGWEANALQVRSIPFLLFDGSGYTVGLTVRNSEGVESVGVI